MNLMGSGEKTKALARMHGTPSLTTDRSSEAGDRHRSLKDTAYDFIRDAIVSGRYGPDDKIDQDEIAKALGISRLPVREALIELSQKGFVTTIPRRGAFVVKLEVEDIEDYFEALELLFVLAAKRAAAETGPEILAELRHLHDEIARYEPSSDLSRFRELNRRFARTVHRVGGSRFLQSTLQLLEETHPGSYYAESPAWWAAESLYRERMLAALAAQDATAAAEVAEQHLRTRRRITLDVLRMRGDRTSESTSAATETEIGDRTSDQ